MKNGPDIAAVAALIGDPARANMLIALLDGAALTAGELAREAGITAQTASGHLARLEAAGLILRRRQGRHSYLRLAGAEVARALEALMGLAARTGARRARPGPKDAQLRAARVCYDHLAGEAGVVLHEALLARGWLESRGEALRLTGPGAVFFQSWGIGVRTGARRPLVRPCLDWSERKSHLAGALGAALLAQLVARGWAARLPGSRALAFTAAGRAAFEALCSGAPPPLQS